MGADEYNRVTISPDLLATGDIATTVTLLRATGCSLADMIAANPWGLRLNKFFIDFSRFPNGCRYARPL